jgi:hypothetical protein
VEYIARTLTSQKPTDAEAVELLRLLDDQRAAYGADPVAARELASFDLERFAHPPAADAPRAEAGAELTDEAAIERAATAVVVSTLLSLDAAVTRR